LWLTVYVARPAGPNRPNGLQSGQPLVKEYPAIDPAYATLLLEVAHDGASHG
jgi:hypothetical protein